MTNPILNITLLQLKRKPENTIKRFTGLDWLLENGMAPRMEDYYKVWFEDHSRDEPACVFDSYDDLLEDMYTIFNYSKPVGYTGHSMSVSDVVAVCEKDGRSYRTRYFFTDNIGFKELKEF